MPLSTASFYIFRHLHDAIGVRDIRARVRVSTNRLSFVYYRVKRFVETFNSHLFIIATRSTDNRDFNRDNPQPEIESND